jgi:hypothetical protein
MDLRLTHHGELQLQQVKTCQVLIGTQAVDLEVEMAA